MYGPPLNVLWNVDVPPSTRARYAGVIEFGEPSYYKLAGGSLALVSLGGILVRASIPDSVVGKDDVGG